MSRSDDQGDLHPDSVADEGRTVPSDDPSVDHRLIISGLSDLVCLHEPDGTYVWVSPSARHILGYEPEELVGRDPYEFFHPEDAIRIRESTHDPALAGEGNIFVRYRLRHRDGHYVWLESLTQPILDDEGKVIRLQTSTRDISEQKQVEQALRESEERYRAVINSLAEGIVVHGHDGSIVACNPSASRILGMSESQLKKNHPADVTWPAIDEDGNEFPFERHPAMQTLNSGEPCRGVLMGFEKADEGRRIWITLNSQPVEHSTDAAVVVSFRDITDWLHTQQELNLWAKVFEASSEAILITDADSNVVSLNQSFTRMTGYEPGDLAGKTSALLRGGNEPEEFFDRLWKTLHEKGTWRGETWNRRKNGETYPIWLSITAVRDRHGEITHYVSIATDITERHARDEHQRYLATHDSLTHLANRALLYDRIEMELRRSRRGGKAFAILFIDLDGFKEINDEQGHRLGDLLLREVARRLNTQVREADTVSRLGGDEFIVILADVRSVDSAIAVAGKVTEAIRMPYHLDGNELFVQASIGISLHPDHGSEPEALIHAADQAMYRAKEDEDAFIAVADAPP